MERFKRFLSFLIAVSLVAGLAACGGDAPAQDTQPTSESTGIQEETQTDPAAAYPQAAAQILEAPALTARLSVTRTTLVGGETFTETSAQTLVWTGRGTDSLACSSTATYTYAEGITREETEVYVGGILYQTGEGYGFRSELTAEEIAGRYLPAVLLDAALYGQITASGNSLTFAQPTAAESWALPEGAEFVEASGTAQLSDALALTRSTYTVTYTWGNSRITLDVCCDITAEAADVAVPEGAENFVSLSDPDAVALVERGIGYLNSAATFSSYTLSSMFTQAAGYMVNNSEALDVYASGDTYMFKCVSGAYARDYYHDETQEYDLEQTYIDGVYTYIEDDGEPVTNSHVSQEALRQAIDGARAANIVGYEYWLDATVTDLGSLYLVEVTLNDAYGEWMQDTLVEQLWSDPDFLNDLAEGYTNHELSAYVGIDKFTGHLTSAGYLYEGAHTIDGVEYLLSEQSDQSFETPALGAYHEITDEMLPEEAPENAPTPLFYHVTGPDGQEMWLLGTIHVGDDRTAYLPQEIFDALAASDALAIECDNDGFEEQADNDESISQAVSDAYYYSDGTTIRDHIDAELYDQALKYMKATGNFNMNADYMKPYCWYSSIDEFFLRQGYQITRDQGIEERLLTFARDNDIPLWEVESCLFQIQLLTGFSPELQELMLEDTLAYAGESNWTGTMELLDLWCSGDEAALRERISCEVDTSELTEEELAEYLEIKPLMDEYNDGISHNRNDGMLQVLIGYLESGDTVFVAVGLAHLLDETNGLVDTLRAAGYTVEAVEFAG